MSSATSMPSVPWGKCSPDGNFHPLVDHCLDVAIVLRTLLDQGSLARVGVLDAHQKDRLAVITFLHDFGKCNWGFQAKADPAARVTAGHVLEACALLFEMESAWPQEWRKLLIDISSWFDGFDEAAFQMLLASVSHHGRPVSENDYRAAGGSRLSRFWAPSSACDPMSGLVSLAKAARQYFPGAFLDGTAKLDASAEFQQRFAGLVMLADWIGESPRARGDRPLLDPLAHAGIDLVAPAGGQLGQLGQAGPARSAVRPCGRPSGTREAVDCG